MKVKSLIGIILCGSLGACSSFNQRAVAYCDVGAAYKLDESEIVWWDQSSGRERGNNEWSALAECGLDYGDFSLGLKHDSQFLQGAPFNNEPEYQKTELFFKKRFELGEL